MAWKLEEKIFRCLKEHSEQRFTAQEIADWIIKTYPDECRQKQERSTTKVNLRAQIAGEIGSRRPRLQKKHPQIKTIEGRPRRYYYTESTDSEEIGDAESGKASSDAKPDGPARSESEQDLYPILSKFLHSEYGIYPKRIDEKRSRNSRGAGGNRWLHPDLVGVEVLSQNWCDEIKNCVQQHADKKIKLWSFEVKIRVNRSNVREVFFQTVSNSSWANFAYLVAGTVNENTTQELRMLASLHGVGVICLDTENPSESQILIPAKERSGIDWDSANRLAKENKDFRECIKLIGDFYKTDGIRKSDWDIAADQA